MVEIQLHSREVHALGTTLTNLCWTTSRSRREQMVVTHHAFKGPFESTRTTEFGRDMSRRSSAVVPYIWSIFLSNLVGNEGYQSAGGAEPTLAVLVDQGELPSAHRHRRNPCGWLKARSMVKNTMDLVPP